MPVCPELGGGVKALEREGSAGMRGIVAWAWVVKPWM